MDFTGYSVNSTAFNIGLSDAIIEAIIQNDLYQDGLGVIQMTSPDVGAGALRVPVIARSSGTFRELGATVNGGFANTANSSSNVKNLTEKIVTLKYLYDEMEDVPYVQGVLSLAAAANVSRRSTEIGKAITKGKNSGTMAAQLVAVINAAQALSSKTGKIYEYNPATSGDMLTKIRQMNAKLNNGDTYHDTYPQEGRLMIVRPDAIVDMFAAGNVIVGGSNFAQELISSGCVEPGVQLATTVMGYRGRIYNVPIMEASDALWSAAEVWAGVQTGAFALINGILCSHIATGRAHAFPDQTYVVPAQNVAGIRIQPLSMFGVEILFEGGIKLLANGSFVLPPAQLTLTAPGSKLVAAPASITIKNAGTVTVISDGTTVLFTATPNITLDPNFYAVHWVSATPTVASISPTEGLTSTLTGILKTGTTDITAEICAVTWTNGVRSLTSLAAPIVSSAITMTGQE